MMLNWLQSLLSSQMNEGALNVRPAQEKTMGMYTEIVVKAYVKGKLPAEVESVLQFLFNAAPEPAVLPDHEFFKCSRWTHIGSMSSYYHIPWASSRYEEGRIFSRSDLKNYEDEIEKFFDWLRPYVDGCQGTCIGYSWYEEAEQPTLVLL